MKRYFNKILVLLTVLAFSACDVLDLETKDNPNFLTPDQADVDLLLNNVQKETTDFFEVANQFGMDVTRMKHMFGPLYFNAYGPTSYDVTWSQAYSTTLQDIASAKALAEAGGLTDHLGVAQTLEAYILLGLVDLFGDVPYQEALQGADNLNPGINGDAGESVYTAAIGLLDAAATNFAATAPRSLDNDFYFGGDMTKWTTLVNTLKLRAYLNMRHNGDQSANINAVLGDVIDAADEDFQFQYSTVNANPDSRHPQFGDNYDNGGNDYMNVHYMALFFQDYDGFDGVLFSDPRLRYYFYRQETSDTNDPNEKSCVNFDDPTHYNLASPMGPAAGEGGTVFCQMGNGYWGRFHGDDDGIPPDDQLRTIWGIYPMGGRFDAGQDERGRITSGAQGAGISPIMLSSYVYFMRAEAALMVGTTDDARTMLSTAIDHSMAKVTSFGPLDAEWTSGGYDAFAATAAQMTDYRDMVLARYDAATTDDMRLAIIIREYYKAAFGNGHEAYNMYRRTGHPTDLQPTFDSSGGGEFIRSHFYPSRLVDRNSSVTQKTALSTGPFWAPSSIALD